MDRKIDRQSKKSKLPFTTTFLLQRFSFKIVIKAIFRIMVQTEAFDLERLFPTQLRQRCGAEAGTSH